MSLRSGPKNSFNTEQSLPGATSCEHVLRLGCFCRAREREHDVQARLARSETEEIDSDLKPEKPFVCRDRGRFCSDSAGFGRGWTVWGDRLLSEPADASDWCSHRAGSTAQIGVQAARPYPRKVS